MLNLLEALAGYVSVPTWQVIGQIVLFLLMQVIGEIMEFFGKVAPGFMKIRKTSQAKKEKERERDEMVKRCEEALEKNNQLFKEFTALYNEDNMEKRNTWINDVNHDREDYHEHQEENRKQFEDLSRQLAKNNEITLAIYIENKRSSIISFAARAADPNGQMTHEEFRRVFKTYEEYEKIIEENNMTNGEVDASIQIIRDAYKDRLKRHAFIEDMRGFNG